MIQPALTDDTVISLHQLHVGEASGPDAEVEVGRPDTGVFVGLPEPGVDLIRMLGAGLELGEVKRRFAGRYGEPPDLPPFVDAIVSCGFVRAIDGQPVTAGPADRAAPPRGWRVLEHLPERGMSWLLSRPMMALYVLVWLAVPALLVVRPDLLPSADRAWISPRVMVNFTALAVLGWVLVFCHELAHLVALRARGCVGSLTLSYRLYFLVAQTNMVGIRSIPRRQRYAPYLAGMTWDLALMLVCLLLQLARIGAAIPGAIVYLLALSVLFQFRFFMRTDLYFVITNLLRLGNLMGDTRQWLAGLVRRALRRPLPASEAAPPERERRLIRVYALFAVAGVAITVGQFVLLGLPLLLHFLAQAVAGLGAGPGRLAFWDSAAFLLVTLAQFAVLGVVVWRERREALSQAANRLLHRAARAGEAVGS